MFDEVALGARVAFKGREQEVADSTIRIERYDGAWSDVLSVSGLEQIPTDRTVGLPTGKRQRKPVTVTKPIDKDTPMLQQSLVGNAVIPKLQVSQGYITYLLEKVRVTSVSKNRGDCPTENVTLTYSKISVLKTEAPKIQGVISLSGAAGISTANHNSTRSIR